MVAEVLKSFLNENGRMPQLYFYRTSNGKEIDLVIERGDVLHPVEVKKAEIARPGDTKAFAELDAVPHYRRGAGAVVCLANEALPLATTHGHCRCGTSDAARRWTAVAAPHVSNS